MTTARPAPRERNFLATLLLSQGVPMILGGDEIGRTQRGNNNAYCQDNDISWFDWRLDQRRQALLGFVRYIVGLRRRHPVLRRRQFFFGRRIRGSEVKDLAWFRPDGREMTDEDWTNAFARCVGLRLAGDAAAMNEVDARGAPVQDDTLLMLLNAHHEPLPFVLSAHHRGVRWEPILDTRLPNGRQRQPPLRRGERYVLEGRSLALLRLAPENGRKRLLGRREERRAQQPARPPEPAGVTEPARVRMADEPPAPAVSGQGA